jgi:hypothetical protein
MIKKQHVYILISAWILWPLMAFAAATLQASVDRNPVGIDETFQLRIVLDDGDRSSVAPDWQVLEKDFYILGQSSGSTYRVEGQQSHMQQNWTLSMQPKRTGSLLIPSLQVGSLRSKSIKMRVNPGAGQKQLQRDLQLETRVSNVQPYVDQPLLYQMKLYSRIPGLQGMMVPPESDNLHFDLLSDQDKQYNLVKDGISYQVVERNFLFSSDHPGQIVLPAGQFKGQMPMSIQSSGLNALFQLQTVRPVQVQGKKEVLAVTAIPKDYQESWLPAENVILRQSWDKGKDHHWRQGQPLSTTITLEVMGQIASNMPKIDFPALESINVYPEKAQVHTELDHQGHFKTILQQTFVLIPMHEGDIRFPGYRLAWWNVLQKRASWAKLPAVNFRVFPGQVSTVLKKERVLPEQGGKSLQPKQIVSQEQTSIWFWLSCILATLLFALLGWMFRARLRLWTTIFTKVRPAKKSVKIADLLAVVERACQEKNAIKVAKAVMLLAEKLWPSQCHLSVLALAKALKHPAFIAEAKQLDRALYLADEGSSWDAAAFLLALKDVVAESRKVQKKTAADVLPPLYQS